MRAKIRDHVVFMVTGFPPTVSRHSIARANARGSCVVVARFKHLQSLPWYAYYTRDNTTSSTNTICVFGTVHEDQTSTSACM